MALALSPAGVWGWARVGGCGVGLRDTWPSVHPSRAAVREPSPAPRRFPLLLTLQLTLRKPPYLGQDIAR